MLNRAIAYKRLGFWGEIGMVSPQISEEFQ